MFVGKTYIPIVSNSSRGGGSCIHPEGMEAVVAWITCVGLVGACFIAGCAFTCVLTDNHGRVGFLFGVLFTMFLVGLSSIPMVMCLL